MSEKPTILLVLLRLTLLLGPVTVLLGLFIAIVVWPESPWARTWNFALVVLSLGSFVSFFVTRSSRKRLKQKLIDESSSNNQETETTP